MAKEVCMGRFQVRKNCLVASSATPVATVSSASENPDAKNTFPTQKVDIPAMSAVTRFSLRMKVKIVHKVPINSDIQRNML